MFEQDRELLLSADDPDNAVLSTEVPVTVGRNIARLAAELHKAKACTAKIESAGTMTVCHHEKPLNWVEHCHVEPVSVWKGISVAPMNSPSINVKVARADNVKTLIEWNMLLAQFEDIAYALQSLVNKIVEWKMVLVDTIAKRKALHEIGRGAHCR